MPTKPAMNLVKLIQDFGSDDKCRHELERIRWPHGAKCPRCESETYRLDNRQQYECKSSECRYQFSVTSGTIFHDSHLPLSKWFLAAYMMIESKKGVSALQIKRELGVAYQTAWHLCHRIRAAMRDAFPMPLRGRVEVDETFIGGEARGKGRGYTGNKALVIGAYQREGKIVLKMIQARDRVTLHNFIHEHIHDDAEAIYTDEWSSYDGIADHNTRHETVNHSAGEYVRGDVHTQGIDNVWGLFKRSVVGTFHHMSIKHLDAYLDELEWRFNNRDNPFLFRDTIKRLCDAEALEYKKLTA
jgi:transposase-like protein